MIRLVASSPSMTGISTSIVIRSGFNSARRWIASAPFEAVPTTRSCGSDWIIAVNARHASGESSTTRTWMGELSVMSSPHQPLDRFDEMVLIERALDDVCLRAHLQAAAFVFFFITRGHDHHGQLFEGIALPKRLAKLKPIHARHLHVGNHEIERRAAHLIERVQAVHSGLDFVPVCLQ